MAAAYTGDPEPPARQLRPLRVGEVLDAAIKLYNRNALTMWKIVAVVVIPLAAIQQIVVGTSIPAGAYVRNGTLYTATGSTSTNSAGLITEIVLTFIGIAAAIAFILFIVPGIWLAVMWCVPVPAVMFEGVDGVQALRRSMQLVRGRWWATFAALLVALVMLIIVLFLVGLALGGIESALGVDSIPLLLAFGALNTLISGLITYPFIGSVIAVIYVDLRVRKEGVDLQTLAGTLGRTAGL